MTDSRLDISELNNLLILLEDRDEETLNIVRDRAFALGWKAVDYFFSNLYVVTEPSRRAFVLERIRQMSSMLAFKQMLDLMLQGPDFYVPDGMYFLTRMLEPELTPEIFRGFYEEMAGSLVCELRDTMTAVEKAEMLNYIMYDKYGFSVSTPSEEEDEPDVLLPRLLKRRSPIFPKTPGYFVGWIEQDRSLFTIDVGNHGRISEPVPRNTWKKTPLIGKDQTILYIYAAALRRFSPANCTRLTDLLLGRALDVLRV